MPIVALDKRNFAKTIDKKKVELFTLANTKRTLIASITNYGGKMVQMLVPDRDGDLDDVVLGCETLDDSMVNLDSGNAIIGRFANRIDHGAFTLNGHRYALGVNENPYGNTLHGGIKGAHRVVFDAALLNPSTLRLKYTFADGEEGFPGNCELTFVYTLTDDNELIFSYEARTDKPTVTNFTQHNYWNLGGAGNGSALDHELYINARAFTPVNERLVPTGEIRDVAGTPQDFTTPKTIRRDIDARDQQLEFCGGYDFNYVLNNPNGIADLAARLTDRVSGRVMELFTSEPGLQLYSGNFIPTDGSLRGKGGKVYPHRCAVCLETQHFPNSPNEPRFPSTVLNPGSTLRSTTIFRFSTTK